MLGGSLAGSVMCSRLPALAAWCVRGALARGAALAESDDREVGKAGVEAELLVDQVADGVEIVERDRCHCRAPLAVEVFVLRVAGEEV